MLGKEPKLVYKNIELKVPNEYEKEFTKVFIFKVSALTFNIYTNH